jgi:hypothetical protein
MAGGHQPTLPLNPTIPNHCSGFPALPTQPTSCPPPPN